ADSVGMPLSHLRLSWLRVACCPEDRCWPAMTCTRKAAPAGQELTARAPPASLAGPLAVPRLEPRHTAAGVQDLLLAGVERVARRADLDADLAAGHCRAGGEVIPTAAGHLGGDVVRVNSGLHGVPLGIIRRVEIGSAAC